RKVRPLLAAHCLKCHPATGKARGGLRLHSRAALLKGGDLGPAVVPGDPKKSRLIEAVEYGDPELQMPKDKKLPAAAIADLRKWVEMGAPWPGDAGTAAEEKFDLAGRKKAHWAWQPLADPKPPATRAKWGRDDADAFILAALEAKGLKPAPDASRQALARRLSFDLVGLPPTKPLGDTEADLEKHVDELLASERFGEKWARHWLDLVRYAETRGHEFDFPIPNAWLYRDHVVRLFNDDVPYDQVLREHVAGDLLDRPRLRKDTNESLLGTAFWFLGEEIHSPVDIRADQADRFDNRIDVLTKAFLGLTVSCARCHDHKFDAISTKDYYALYGHLTSSGYRLARIDGWKENRAVLAKLEKLRAGQSAKLPELGKPGAEKVVGDVIVDYADLKPGQWLPDDVSFGSGPALGGTYRLGRAVTRTAAEYDPFWDALKHAPGTEQDPGSLGANRAGRTIRTPGFKVAGRAWALVRGAGRMYAAAGSHVMIAGPLHGRIVQGFGASKDFRWVGIDLTPYKGQPAHLELTAGSADFAVARVVQSDRQPPAPEPSKPAAVEGKLFDEWRAAEKELAKEVRAVSRLAPAMLDGTGMDEPVFLRGQHRTPGPTVPRRFLEAFGGKPARAVGSGRLELAEEMLATPLVPRVIVNRLWHHLFGRGIVASVDDFGVMGQPPTHPELLDFLATRFVKEGWSLKKAIRRLVLSRTYRQASGPFDKADPENRLWHRAMLRRLPGEAIRDAMLAVSGRLDAAMGGPAVPVHLTAFQDGRGRPGSGPVDGNGRRSVYLAVRRNFLSPFLLAFDTPSPFSTVGRRTVSNVPAQSLILLNDPFVHGQAAAWAKRELSKPGSAAERVERMHLAAFGRKPTKEEASACLGFLGGKPGEADWAALAHSLFNVKEFVFVE
ncbi:MAG: PSD1 and planctomycete cytochrome C domain-containing protein, partial [Gemmataceae bacterium]|nr:PSD1 and planctomycete cytochrome C domain-containing protein [Gemmataceae bacterium]